MIENGYTTLLPYEYEITCISCGYTVMKRKQWICKIQRKKVVFIRRLERAQHNFFCKFCNIYNLYGGNDFD